MYKLMALFYLSLSITTSSFSFANELHASKLNVKKTITNIQVGTRPYHLINKLDPSSLKIN